MTAAIRLAGVQPLVLFGDLTGLELYRQKKLEVSEHCFCDDRVFLNMLSEDSDHF